MRAATQLPAALLLLLLLLLALTASLAAADGQGRKSCSFSSTYFGAVPYQHVRNMATLSASHRNYDHAYACFEDALELNSTDVQTYYQYLKARYEEGQPGKDTVALVNKLQEACEHWACSYLLGCTAYDLFRNEKASDARAKRLLDSAAAFLESSRASMPRQHGLWGMVRAFEGLYALEAASSNTAAAAQEALQALREALLWRREELDEDSPGPAARDIALYTQLWGLVEQTLEAGDAKAFVRQHLMRCSMRELEDTVWPALLGQRSQGLVPQLQPATTAAAATCPDGHCTTAAAAAGGWPAYVVYWEGFLFEPFGYGQDTRELIIGAASLGVPLVPVNVKMPAIRVTLTEEEDAWMDALRESPLALHTLRQRPARTGIPLHINVFQSIPNFYDIAHTVHGADYLVIRTVFESNLVPADWLPVLRRADEIWVATQFNVDTFQAAEPALQGRLHIVPESIDDALFFSPSKAHLRQPFDLQTPTRFTFVAVFDFHRRKGWDTLVRAWVREFTGEDDVCLMLKTWSSQDMAMSEVNARLREAFMNAARPGRSQPCMVMASDYLSAEQMPRFYAAADAFVSATRGEGWGRPMMEAMAAGLPVIATNWSGHTAFVRRDTAVPVAYRLVDIDAQALQEYPYFTGHKWAMINGKDLQRQMRRVYEGLRTGAQWLKDVRETGRQWVKDNYSRAAVGRIVRQRIEQLVQRHALAEEL